jgi:GGDEF domain-containing protein
MLSTTLSAGLAGYPEDGPDVWTVMANADEAIYVSKRGGKNRLTLFTGPVPDSSSYVSSIEGAAL